MDLRQMHVMAEEYVSERRWPIVVIPPVNGRPVKGPTEKGWQENLLEPGMASSTLGANFNIGLLLRDYVNTDLDCIEARLAANVFLPATGLIWGHMSSPASHRLYRVSVSRPYKKFSLAKDDRGAVLEWRTMTASVNGAEPKAFQTLLPPSVHPSGEQYTWTEYKDAALVDGNELWRAVHLTAICAALAKLHPPFDDEHKTQRDEYRLAIAGVLLRRLEQDALKIFTHALRIAGDHKDRTSIFEQTRDKLRNGNATTGIPALKKILGEQATPILNWIQSIGGEPSDAASTSTSNAEPFEEELVIGCMKNVTEKKIEWLWKDRIPENKLTIFSGNPDTGKTTTLIDFIARYTQGRKFPDSEDITPVGEVLMLISEDNLDDTVKPRLHAADADMSKIHFVKAVEIRQGAKREERMLALDSDIALLEKALKMKPTIRVVCFDPLTGYVGRAKINDDQELRRVLIPLRELAERAQVTIVGLGHFNKRSDVSALHRVGGAVAMSGVARAVWMFTKDPDDSGLYKMLLGKGNLTKKRTGLKYRFEEKMITLPDQSTTGVPVITWEGEVTETADDALEARDPEIKKLAKAKRFLLEHFKQHPGLQPSQPIIDEAENKHGISEPTLRRARRAMGIKVSKPLGVWSWELVTDPED
jgi:putative DNA primase/helicase